MALNEERRREKLRAIVCDKERTMSDTKHERYLILKDIFGGLIRLIALLYVTGGSFYFGYCGKPTEMGLLIVAGVISLVFANIDRISEFKVGEWLSAKMKDFEARIEETAAKVDVIASKEAEPEPEPSRSAWTCKSYATDEPTKQVLKCLLNPQFTWRTVGGIVKESSLASDVVSNVLAWLAQNKLALAANFGSTELKWGLTDTGRELANAIIPSEA